MKISNVIKRIHEDAFDAAVLDIGEVRKCEACGHEGKDVVDCPSQTHYPFDCDLDEEGSDPNRDKILCIACAVAYTEDIEDRRAEYYAGLL